MMRTDEEFKAEVYRRSQKRIQKRNANRRKLIRAISCSAAVLCCIITAWYMIPFQEDEHDKASNLSSEITTPIFKDDSIKNDSKNQGLEESGVIVMIDVEIQSTEGMLQGIYKISHSQEIKEFTKVVDSIEQSIKNNELDGDIETSTEDKSEDVVYIFTLIDSIGEETEYILRGNILWLSESKEKYILTQEHAGALLKQLIRYKDK